MPSKTVLLGQPIAKGQAVLAFNAGGGMDQSAWDHPHTFDVARADAHQDIPFGIGTFRCIGARVAELQARVAVERIVARLADIELLHLTWPNHPLFHVPAELHVTATIR